MQRQTVIITVLFLVLAAIWTTAQGPLTNALNLGVHTDANGYLIATSAAYTGPDGPLTNLGNIRLRTDANGYLLTTANAPGTFGTSTFPAGTIALPSINFVGNTTTGWSNPGNVLTASISGTQLFAINSSQVITSTNFLPSTNNACCNLGLSSAQFIAAYLGTGVYLGAAPAVIATAPTVTSGFGSGSAGTVVSGSTTFSFRITVGTNAGGTTGVIGLPTATTFWNCDLRDMTTVADLTNMTASTVNAATFTATVAWTTGDVLQGGCKGS
jgi:hypothetical protein